MDEAIIKFVADNFQYLCIPFGLGYPIYRRIVGDRRKDRREDQKDTFVTQLHTRLQEMQVRGDNAMIREAQAIAEVNVLTTDLQDIKQKNVATLIVVDQLREDIRMLRETNHTLEAENRRLNSRRREPR